MSPDRRLQPALLALLTVWCSVLFSQESIPGAARFLIVVPEYLAGDLAGELRQFQTHKSKTVHTDVLPLESILRGFPGVDDAEKLKRGLLSCYQKNNTRWVLLIGDSDVMPVRYMVLDRATPAAFDYAFYPSDLYYADLLKADGSFEDWNGEKEGFHAGYFGEVRGEKNKTDPINYDRVDYKPELAVGRWPVSDPAQLRLIVGKSIRHDEAAAAREPWLRRAAACAVGGWVDARGTMDRATASLGKGWTIEKRYYADAGQKPEAPLPTEAEICKLLNDGTGLVFHAGHGSDDSWAGCFSVGSFKHLENARRPAVMMSCGCSTARFTTLPPYEGYVDVAGVAHKGTNAGEVFTSPPPPPAVYQSGAYDKTGLGERLLRDGANGAVAYIGCNTGSQPCGLTLIEGFTQAVGASKRPRLGDCWRDAIRYYWDAQHLATLAPNSDWYPPSIFFQGMKFMLFGDPTLEL